MRLWSLEASCLDPKGLVAAWREALLAQKVLEGETKGYRNHPQLERFRASPEGQELLALFLAELEAEARRRGYAFDRGKIHGFGTGSRKPARIRVAEGQLRYEYELLKAKLEARDKAWLEKLPPYAEVGAAEVFEVVPGPIEAWERTRPDILERLVAASTGSQAGKDGAAPH
jgi:hypothetical protein